MESRTSREKVNRACQRITETCKRRKEYSEYGCIYYREVGKLSAVVYAFSSLIEFIGSRNEKRFKKLYLKNDAS